MARRRHRARASRTRTRTGRIGCAAVSARAHWGESIMAEKDEVGLPELGGDGGSQGGPLLERQSGGEADPKRAAVDLEAVYDVPVTVQAILGKSAMEVSQLLKLGRGT